MENEDIRFNPNFSFVEKGKSLHVDGVFPISPNDHQNSDKRQKRRSPSNREEAKDHFEELAKAAEASNAILVRTHSPYRFCVYRKGGEIFIDLATLNKEGKIGALRMANITHEDFTKWLRHIEEREGLFLDEIG